MTRSELVPMLQAMGIIVALMFGCIAFLLLTGFRASLEGGVSSVALLIALRERHKNNNREFRV